VCTVKKPLGDNFAQRHAQVARQVPGHTGQLAQRTRNVIVLLLLFQGLQTVASNDVTDFMRQNRSQLVVVCQLEQRTRDVDVSARQRETIDLAALNHMEFVKHIWPQAGSRTTLTEAFHPIQAHVRQAIFLRYFAVKLRAELNLVALVQKPRV